MARTVRQGGGFRAEADESVMIGQVQILGAPEPEKAVAALQAAHPDVPLFLGAVDSHLNDVGYIVPGLGDAGDRQFGTA